VTTVKQIAAALRNALRNRIRRQTGERRPAQGQGQRSRPTLGSGHRVFVRKPLAPAKPPPRVAELDVPLQFTDELFADVARQVLAKFKAPRIREGERVMHAALVQRGGASRHNAHDSLLSHLAIELRVRSEREEDPKSVTRRWLRGQGHNILGELAQWAWELLETARSIRDEPQVRRHLRESPEMDVREASCNNASLFFLVEERGSKRLTIADLLTERELAVWLKPKRVSGRASR
jgi:hypothetical protein